MTSLPFRCRLCKQLRIKEDLCVNKSNASLSLHTSIPGGWICELEAAGRWPLTPKIDRATWAFLKFDMRHRAYSDMQHGGKNIVTWDRAFSTFDIVENKRQRHASLPFLKIGM